MNKIEASIAAIAAMTVLVACGGNDAANDSTTVASQVTATTSTLAPTPPTTPATEPPVAPSPEPRQDAPKVHQVATYGTSFSPENLSIAVGDTVEFSIGGHNVTWSDTGTTHNDPYSRTFTTAGSYDYLCTRHAGMSGVITVG